MKKAKIFITTTLLAATISSNAYAGSWQQNETGYWWQNDDGSYPVNTWQWVDGNNDGISESYYFNENGYCLMNTITPDGFTVDANGAWTVNGIIQTQAVTPAENPVPQLDSAPMATGISTTPYEGYTIVVNTSTKKYHTLGCRFVDQMNTSNTAYSNDAVLLESQEYEACKVCH